MRVLLVEDDPVLAGAMGDRLRKEGFVVDCMASLADAVEATMMTDYQIVLLDRRLPDGDGLSLIPILKTRAVHPPIIALSALDDVSEKITGLDAGADDYLAKPFVFNELLARIRVLLRRDPTARSVPAFITIARLVYDVAAREASVEGVTMHLPRRELAILEALVGRAGRVVMREYLEAQVYGHDDEINSNALDSHISKLRKRLVDAGAGVLLQGVRGLGYILRAP